ncbi:MAG TPA: molybdopterin-binding/glycosyltransferase family 2 protein [Alphaproteobacteria bacterium]|nr:molybdopterin-binding/glycosyltransferase family 2 protein [Alphaproteobacteria bacterium]
MKFGPVAIAEAAGAILAHGVRAGTVTFKKGRLLTPDDVAQLTGAQVETVIAARLEPGDIGEDEAAGAIAEALCGPHLTRSAAFTGRCNLFADVAGLAVVDGDRLDRINLLSEAVTVATLPAFAPTEPRQMVATIKIIPFAAPSAIVEAATMIARAGTPILRVEPFRTRRVALIQTRLPGTKPSVLEKTVEATRARVAALGSELTLTRICGHSEAELATEIATARAQGCDPILVLGASAITDRRDVIPGAIVAQGGEIRHFGMPVDPGNLLLLAKLGDADVVGLPGCARSPKRNGFDWILQRLLADVPVSRQDIMRMGVGGLLGEIAIRPLPRGEAAPEPTVAPPRAPRIAAVILAAGRSTRMGAANKLLAEVDGQPMIDHAVDAALASQARPVVVVAGHDAAKVRAAIGLREAAVVENPDHAQGLSTSVRAGIAALPAEIDGALFMLADMPRVGAAHIDRLIAAFNPVEGRAICVPTHKSKRGNPVLWAARFFPEMRTIEGDMGARRILAEHAEQVCEVEMPDDAILLDIDTPEALAALRSASPKVRA